MFDIESIKKNGYACLAPMAGVCDTAFREICKEYGSAYCVTEMVSAKGISYNSEKSAKLMEISENERPCAVQVFGDEPNTVAKAAEFALQFSPFAIDINMGCPAPKICNNGSGCALMKNPHLCGEIVKAVKNAVDIPVTVKIRKGFEKDSNNAVEVAKICEQNGADAITVHGRTREQYYSGRSDLDVIKAVKESVSVPVIGNGDIISAKDAKRMYEYTGCDLVMVGRGALGNPFIFSEINAFFTGDEYKIPDIEERLSVMKRHAQRIVELNGEYIGIRMARKHVAYYIKGFKSAAHLRTLAFSLESLTDLDRLIEICKESIK